MIRVVICKVGEEPVVTKITSNLETMQSLVGGYIEFVDIGQNLSIVCNEEAIFEQLPQNRCGILGDFFFTKTGPQGSSVSLSDAEVTVAQLYAEVFKSVKHRVTEPKIVFFDTLDEMQVWLENRRPENLN